MLPLIVPKPLLMCTALRRAIFPTSTFRGAHDKRPHISAHVYSAPASILHRLATSTPSFTSIAGNATGRPLLSKPFLPKIQVAPRAPFSFWPFGNEKSIQQRVIEASPRYRNLDDRQLLLLYLDKQDEAWKKQSSSVRMPSWSDYAGWVFIAAAVFYVSYYVWPPVAAGVEKSKKQSDQIWHAMESKQRLILDKVVEIEKRLDK